MLILKYEAALNSLFVWRGISKELRAKVGPKGVMREEKGLRVSLPGLKEKKARIPDLTLQNHIMKG